MEGWDVTLFTGFPNHPPEWRGRDLHSVLVTESPVPRHGPGTPRMFVELMNE